MPTETTIIIGAGHNGLAAAAILARSGRRVLVLERREIIGGIAAGEEFHPGYRTAGLLHDTTQLAPVAVDALQLKQHGLELIDPPPLFAPQRDGRGLLLEQSAEKAEGELSSHCPGDADSYRAWRRTLQRFRPFLERWRTQPPPPIFARDGGGQFRLLREALALRRLGRRDMLELLRVAPMCAADWLNERFSSPLLKSALAGPSLIGTWAGPWSPATAFNVLLRQAVAGMAVRGGPQALVNALQRAAEGEGVEIRTGAEVASIRIDGGGVIGVVLTDGDQIDARQVFASCDPKHLLLDLAPATLLTPRLQHRIENLRTRGTTAKVNLALAAPLRFAGRDDLPVERAWVGQTLDEIERAFDPVKYREYATEPVLDVAVPSASDSALAPEGHCVVSILVHAAAYDRHGGWSDETRAQLGDVVVRRLAQYAPHVVDDLVAREVLTPADLAQRYRLTGGHIHHGEHALDQLLVRPSPECMHYRTPIPGLFLCGSGAHPGGGLTCLPGYLAATAVAG